MVVSIIKDSLIIFLLVYAVLQLAESFLQFLLRHLSAAKTEKRFFYVLNALGTTPDCLEGLVRSTARRQEEIFLVSDEQDEETKALVAILCKEFEHLTPISPEALQLLLTEETALGTSLKAR
ncbi:MAG: hypothetical protein E7414_02850 [Ruminococcaceae bacterium]|nr:hypothetical protein [Oscillospiraceae bacterium]